jgi:hypothetical protein
MNVKVVLLSNFMAYELIQMPGNYPEESIQHVGK